MLRTPLLLVAAPALLAAQPPTRADSVERARRDSLARLLPTVEITASVLPVAGPAVSSGVPARVAVLAGDAFGGARLLAEGLAAQPGVSLYDDLGSAYKPTLVVRGFTASPVVGLPQGLSVFVDGVPVNEPDAGQVNWDLLPLQHVRAVEVVSGTAALLGPNSLGGAVNLVTRRGGEAGPAASIELGAGSHGRRTLDASIAGTHAGWRAYAGGGWRTEDGWRQLTAARGGDLFANIGRGWDGGGALNLQLHAATSRVETAGSLPRSVYVARPDSNLSSGDFEDLAQLHVALSGRRPAWRGTLSASLWGRLHDAERFNVNQVADPDVRGFSENRVAGLAVDWRATRPLGAATLGVRIGAGASASRTEVQLHAERIDPGLTTNVHAPVRELDAYVVADWTRGSVTVTGGLRQDVVRVPFHNRLNPARDTVSTYARLNPSLGVSVNVGGGVTAYASGARGFRAPAVIELACADPEEPCPLPFALGDDPPLAPVVVATGEVGARLARGPLQASVSAWRTSVRDDIYLLPYDEDAGEPEGSTIDGFFANLPRTRRDGVEAGLSLAAGAVRAHATYGFTRATFRSAGLELFSIREAAGEENEIEVGDRLPLVPTHTFAAGLDGARGPLRAGLVARYTGERPLRGDEANDTPPLDAHWLADLRLGLDRGAWDVEATVTNLLDADYERFGTFNLNQGAGNALERFLTPGDPRMLFVTLRHRWGR